MSRIATCTFRTLLLQVFRLLGGRQNETQETADVAAHVIVRPVQRSDAQRHNVVQFSRVHKRRLLHQFRHALQLKPGEIPVNFRGHVFFSVHVSSLVSPQAKCHHTSVHVPFRGKIAYPNETSVAILTSPTD